MCYQVFIPKARSGTAGDDKSLVSAHTRRNSREIKPASQSKQAKASPVPREFNSSPILNEPASPVSREFNSSPIVNEPKALRSPASKEGTSDAATGFLHMFSKRSVYRIIIYVFLLY